LKPFYRRDLKKLKININVNHAIILNHGIIK